MKQLILILTLMASANVYGQYVTYDHDASKMNQITVAEIGTGSLTPSLYYDLLHKSYSKTASEKNKLSFRSSSAVAAYQQIDDAEDLDSALIKRAEVEALNIADRKGGALDVAWAAEGSKITEKLSAFEKNISRIRQAGGTTSDQSYWLEYYYVYQTAIKATQSAYMPNSQRKKQYLQIYADITKKNELLLNYIVSLANSKQTSKLLAATYTKPTNKPQLATAAKSRWAAVSQKVANKGK